MDRWKPLYRVYPEVFSIGYFLSTIIDFFISHLFRDVLRSHILDISVIPLLVITPNGVEQGYPQNREKSLLFTISCSLTHIIVSLFVFHITIKLKDNIAQHSMKTAKNFDSQPRHQRRQEKVQEFIRFWPLLAAPLKRRQTAGRTSLMKKNVR